MKKFISQILIIVALCAASTSAFAGDDPGYQDVSLSVPALVNVATVSNGVNAVLDVRKQSNVALSVHTGIGTNIVYRLSASVDGSSWHTNYYTLTFNTIAAAVNPTVTNLNCSGVGYLRVESITNNSPTIIATNTAKYGQAVATSK